MTPPQGDQRGVRNFNVGSKVRIACFHVISTFETGITTRNHSDPCISAPAASGYCLFADLLANVRDV
jgi:hypothetical protein